MFAIIQYFLKLLQVFSHTFSPSTRKYYEVQKRNLLFPNEDYIRSKENVNKADVKRFNKVFNLHKNLKGKMLDVGCNDGYFMRTFKWKFDSFVGIDIYDIHTYTHGKYKDQQKKYINNGKIRYLSGPFESASPFLGNYDFVFAGEIIEHVEDADRFVRALQCVLKPNGRWCITTPNDIGLDLEEHNRQFSKQSLHRFLSKYFASFQVDILKSPGNSWSFLVAYGTAERKLLKNK